MKTLLNTCERAALQHDSPMAMNDFIRFHCETNLRERLQRIALAQHKKEGTLAREILWKFVEAQEREAAQLNEQFTPPAPTPPAVESQTIASGGVRYKILRGAKKPASKPSTSAK